MHPHTPWNALLPGLLACASLTAEAPPAPVAGTLDWSAPHRWVHVDTVGRDGVALFEGARLRWLKALRAGAAPLPDGRPLFWSGDHEGLRTYLTFSPFGEIAELDARGRLVAETQARLGEQAVKDYDSGDAALVPPHYTQIWRRQPDDDFVSPVAGELTELTAAHARLQLLQLDLQAAERVDVNWKEVRELLARQRYPLTCRVLTSRYGLGQTMLLWLAADAESLRRATPLLELLRQAPGEPRGVALAREYSTLRAQQQQLDLVRRDELSNLPRLSVGPTSP